MPRFLWLLPTFPNAGWEPKNPASDTDDARKEAEREAEQEPEAPNPLPNWIVGLVPALGHGEEQENSGGCERCGQKDEKGCFLDRIQPAEVGGGNREHDKWKAPARGKKTGPRELDKTLRGDDQIAGERQERKRRGRHSVPLQKGDVGRPATKADAGVDQRHTKKQKGENHGQGVFIRR